MCELDKMLTKHKIIQHKLNNINDYLFDVISAEYKNTKISITNVKRSRTDKYKEVLLQYLVLELGKMLDSLDPEYKIDIDKIKLKLR